MVLPRFADGSKIAFYKRYRGEADLYTMNANGTGAKRITNNYLGKEYSPDWSPSGSQPDDIDTLWGG